MIERLISLLGLGFFVGISYLFSVNRKAVRWPPVLWGIALQLIFALIILKTAPGLALFKWLGDVVSTFLNYSDIGAKFVFGEKIEEHLIAFKILPTIIFFSSFINLFYHYGILQKVVQGIAWLMSKTMKTSGSETLYCASSIFVGQTEAQLLIKPFISTMTLSELHAIMTGGFATIAGGVMAAYISFGIPAEHLIAASVMSAPAALAISKLLYPETEKEMTGGDVTINLETHYANAVDAVASGAIDGLKLAANVAAMLIAFLGLLAALNGLLGWIGSLVNLPQLSLEWIFSYLMAPLAWLMGVPWEDCSKVGILLGKKTILNEFIAYLDLKSFIEKKEISERAQIIAVYALCGFSNIGSIGIQIGGIGAIAPERKGDAARLGIQAMIAGSFACFMTACIAGILL
jgi:concentrative nucleoside transporter, CNT family